MSQEPITAHHGPALAVDRSARMGRPNAGPSRAGAGSPGLLWVGTWSGEDFVVLKGQLVSVTQNGLFAVVDGPVRAGQRIWLRLDGTASSATNVPALVLGATWLRRGRCALRLELPENGPVGFYEALVREFSRARAQTHAPRPSPPR